MGLLGSDFLKDFPLKFPYGIGGIDINGDEMEGVKYYQYLRDLSYKIFHSAEFVTILNNMFKRRKMINNGNFFRMTNQEQYEFVEVTGD